MSITLTSGTETITFHGMKGTIQLPKPVVETFTSLGASTRYIQRLRSESLDSKVNLWTMYVDRDLAWNTEVQLKAIVGLRGTMVADGETINNIILLDYTYSIKVGANNKILLEVEATFVTDEGE